MAEPAERDFAMDIELELEEDDSGELRSRLRDELREQISAIGTLTSAGVAPAEFRRLDSMKRGLQSAEIVLERIWLHYHPPA